MNKKRVAVLMGGWSSEREISFMSGKGVVEALKKLGHTPIAIDVQKNLPQLISDLSEANPDIIFNILHGTGGEDGVIQGVLEMLQIPYTSSGLTASSVGMDKYLSRIIFKAHGIDVPKSCLVPLADFNQHPMSFPYVIKPVANGSTVGVTIIHSDEDLKKALDSWSYGKQVLVEEYIPGRDIFIALFDADVLGAPIEVVVHDGFYDYENKYTDNRASHIIDPQVDVRIREKMLDDSALSAKLLGCRGLSRVDLRYDDTGDTPRAVLLEINTVPGMTPLSLVCDSAKSIGLSYENLIQKMIDAAICDPNAN